MRPDPPAASPAISPTPSNKELSVPSSPAATSQTLNSAGLQPVAPAPLSSRPKLNLQKRTVSQAEPSPGSTSAGDPKASPFGAARPIDTSARDKEIEEKRELAIRQKKEADDKARDEKRAADEKAKEERRLAKEAEKAAPPKEKSNGQVAEKENGVETPGKNYQILRRAANEDSAAADEEAEAVEADGVIAEDKAIKPQEIVRDIPSKKANGVESQQQDSSPDASADILEDDGWSTVSKPRNSRRGGHQAARAIAS